MKFKIGDRVRMTKIIAGVYTKAVETVTHVDPVKHYCYAVRLDNLGMVCFSEDELELIESAPVPSAPIKKTFEFSEDEINVLDEILILALVLFEDHCVNDVGAPTQDAKNDYKIAFRLHKLFQDSLKKK